MNEELITLIEKEVIAFLDEEQIKRLHEVLIHVTYEQDTNTDDSEIVKLFLAAKRVEGCSEKTIKYYDSTIRNMLNAVNKDYLSVNTDDLRIYLNNYQEKNNVSKVTIDNIRRILSSFFAWLEDEDYITKSPVRRIHKIKLCKKVKETYSDENLEVLRDNAGCARDLAIIDLLASTGMRVGELVKLNKSDINFEDREIIVLGKGNKQRVVYFDARTKLHLQTYLNDRTDSEESLFVSLQKPYKRLQISGVEIRLRELGRKLKINRVHPHKFRRTLATVAIDKGMPIEQVQCMLGHQSIDTTLQYAMVNQHNVKIAHKKFLG